MHQSPTTNGTAARPRVQTRPLIIGIKRNLATYAQATIDAAQHAFAAVRTACLTKFNYTCQYCGFKSLSNGLTHLDSDHHHNVAANLMPSCHLCHAYHHVGQEHEHADAQGIDQAQKGSDRQIVLIRAPADPNLSADQFNHLLRAIAIALNDEKEAPEAMKVLTALVQPELRQEMQNSLVSSRPSDISLALSKLTDDEYQHSRHILRDVRAIYSPTTLKQWGAVWATEQPEIADPAQWAAKTSAIMEYIEPDKDGVGIEALEIEEMREDSEQYQLQAAAEQDFDEYQ